MASLEIGSKSKSIQYLSVSKSAERHGEFCSTDDRWSNPVIHKQNDYLVALSRFEVPLTRVPITAQMDNCIQIFKYKDEAVVLTAADTDNMSEAQTAAFATINVPGPNARNLTFDRNIEFLHKDPGVPDDKQTAEEAGRFLDACEGVPQMCMTPVGTNKAINMPACYTLYEFVTKLNAQIKEALLIQGTTPITPMARIAHNAVGTALAATDKAAYVLRGSTAHPNLFQTGIGANATTPLNMTDPMARFEITVDSDSTFRVTMNQWFSQWYYIKFSQELFDMLQFREKTVAAGEPFDRLNLPGRRFMGDRFIDVRTQGGAVIHEMTNPTTRNPDYWASVTMDQAQASTPPYTPYTRPVNVFTAITQIHVNQNAVGPLQATTMERMGGALNYVSDYQCTFTAANSAADSINRNKALIFSSSLATTSESVSGNTYRKIMTNFTIPISNNFSWNPATMQGGGISEEARSTLIYTNSNPSGGRWLKLSDPSPLYELKMDVSIKVWDYLTNTFKFEPVPLPEGSSFTCKLIFISNNELYHQERPDSIHRT